MSISQIQQLITTLQHSVGVAVSTADSWIAQANNYGDKNPEMRNALLGLAETQSRYIFFLAKRLITLRVALENEQLRLKREKGEQSLNDWMQQLNMTLDDYWNKATEIQTNIDSKKIEKFIEHDEQDDNPVP